MAKRKPLVLDFDLFPYKEKLNKLLADELKTKYLKNQLRKSISVNTKN